MDTWGIRKENDIQESRWQKIGMRCGLSWKRRGNAGSGSPFQTPIGGFDIVYNVHDGNPPPPQPPNNSTLAGIMGALLKGIKKSRRRVENRIKALAAPSLVQLMQTSISSHMRATTALSLFLDSPGLSRNPSRNPWEASTGSVPRERSAGASKSVLGLSPSRFCLVMQHSSPNQSKNYGELSVHKTQNIQLLDLMLGQ